MAASARQLITGALRLINVVQVNETPSPSDMEISLTAFDQMLDSWSNDRLMVYTINPYIFDTVGGQYEYLLGPGNGVLTVNTIVGGAAYVNGNYTNVPLTGGTGSGAYANITVSSGAVAAVFIATEGMGYVVGDVLSASTNNLGGFGAGFTCTVATIDIGDWNIVRPLRIKQAYVIWNSGTEQVDLPIALLNDAQYASIAVKDTPSTFPFALYDNNQYPLRTITVWPVPTVGTPLRLWLRQPLVDFSNLDAITQYPPGYERAFRFCLAVELAAEFGKTIPAEVTATAIKSKEELASMNAVPQYQNGDGGLTGKMRPFNWITGGFVPFGPR